MNLFSALFNRRRRPKLDHLSAADDAIARGRAGQLTAEEMLRQVTATEVILLLQEAPKMDGDQLVSWKPATVSKSEGIHFLLAFTNQSVLDAFVKMHPAFPFAFKVKTRWMLSVLPPQHGILFNVGGVGFEWEPTAVDAYRRNVLGSRSVGPARSK